MYLKNVVTFCPKFWLVTLTYKVQTSVHSQKKKKKKYKHQYIDLINFISLKRSLINFRFYIPTSSKLIDGNPYNLTRERRMLCKIH